jgi:hypothetical protein
MFADETDVVHSFVLEGISAFLARQTLFASCAGLTRASMLPHRCMDCRIKSGNDEGKIIPPA